MNAHNPFDAKQDWTNPYCQNSSNDPMVDALLGNAYHVVRTVYCNLGNLKLIYDFLNQYGMVIGVNSEEELKALSTQVKYSRIYGFSRAGDRQVTDYLYVEGDRTGIIPDDTEATGSWITVATSGSNSGGTSSGEGAYIPWVYSNGSATGGETSINVPDGTVGVPFIIVNGDMQYVGRGFEFNADNLSITLAQPLEEGDEVVFLLTGVPAVPDNPTVNDWIQINWLYNNGAAVGGEQVIAIPYTFQSVPAVYKNGLRLYKGLTTESYTADPDNQRILLTEPLATNDRLIVQIGGEAQVLEAPDHTLQEVARATNVKDSEVILSTDTTQFLNDKKVVYSVSEQKAYGLPSLPTNVYIQSVSNGQLTYAPGSVTVNLIPVTNSAEELKQSLSSTTGSSMIGHGSETVGEILTSLQASVNDVETKVYKQLLNISELRTTVPTQAGEMVYLVSSYSTSVETAHLGGGYFQAINNTQALPDDGGIVIHSSHPTLVWKRCNVINYDMQFWGVVANTGVDNAPAITRATQYAKTNRIILEAPAGSIMTSEMVPIYNNMGIRGKGAKAEGTVFLKTTNSFFEYKNGTVVVESVDALVGFVPTKMDRADHSMDSFCVHGRLEDCMFRRYGLTQENVESTRPYYGLFLAKSASPVIRQVSLEGGYIGVGFYCVFSGVMEMVSATQWNGYGYAGISGTDYRNSILYNSGTSMDMRLVQVRGYQFGFQIARLQYTTMTNCTAEEISPISGETVCYAFDFTDPYSIVMNTCATEFVTGGQIRVSSHTNPSFVRSLTVNGYLPIDQQNPAVSTPIYSVDSGGAGSLRVTFNGGDLSRDTSKANNAAPVVSGAGAKVVIINAGGEDWTPVASGEFVRLA